jgi:hypothetical protein
MEKIFKFFCKNYKKDVQATGEASIPQNVQHFKTTYFFFCGSFLPTWVHIRIQPTTITADLYADPDSQHWFLL